jgi:hypothetical protein
VRQGIVIPAKAGIQFLFCDTRVPLQEESWIPAFAGMT